MCTVFAYEGCRLDEACVLARLEKTKMRGPDSQRIVWLPSKGFMAFQRLSIMGLEESGMQPFELDGLLSITNGELYGFRKMRKELEEKGYVFASGSDCEIMLPMYREYSTEMFSRLDAEFAAVIYDPAKGFIAVDLMKMVLWPLQARPACLKDCVLKFFPFLQAITGARALSMHTTRSGTQGKPAQMTNRQY